MSFLDVPVYAKQCFFSGFFFLTKILYFSLMFDFYVQNEKNKHIYITPYNIAIDINYTYNGEP